MLLYTLNKNKPTTASTNINYCFHCSLFSLCFQVIAYKRKQWNLNEVLSGSVSEWWVSMKPWKESFRLCFFSFPFTKNLFYNPYNKILCVFLIPFHKELDFTILKILCVSIMSSWWTWNHYSLLKGWYYLILVTDFIISFLFFFLGY